jgi:organic radical activating enzyme
MDISDETLRAFFSKLSGTMIGDLTITGGEPSLAPKKILYILELLKEYDIEVGKFYLVMNGKAIPDDFPHIVKCDG